MDTICVSQHVVSQMCELLFSSPIPLLLLCPESNSKRSSVNVQCTACTDGRRAKQRWVRWAMFTFRALYGSFWYMWDDLMTDSVSAAACTEMIRNVQYSFFSGRRGRPVTLLEKNKELGKKIRTEDHWFFSITESTEFGVQPCCTGSVEVAAATSPTSRSAESPSRRVWVCDMHRVCGCREVWLILWFYIVLPMVSILHVVQYISILAMIQERAWYNDTWYNILS